MKSLLNANGNSDNRDPTAYRMTRTRRSRLQRVVLEVLAAAHADKSPKGFRWIESRAIASAVAKEYGGRVKSEFQPHSWWTNYRLTGIFRAVFSRSLKALEEQGAVERRGTQIRLPLKEWKLEWVAT